MGDVSEAGKTHHTVEHSLFRSLLVALGPPFTYGRCLRCRQNAPYRPTLAVMKSQVSPPMGDVSGAGKTQVEHSLFRSLLVALGPPLYVWEMSQEQAKRTIPSNTRCNEVLGFPPPMERLRSRQHAPHRRTLAVTKPPGGHRFPWRWETSPKQAKRTIPSNTRCYEASWRP